jgi:hypothetical protein
VAKTGQTPVLEGAEWRKLLESIPTTNGMTQFERSLHSLNVDILRANTHRRKAASNPLTCE